MSKSGRLTHTYARIEISQSAYNEIRQKLEAAGYADQFHENVLATDNPIIDLHGIAVVPETKEIPGSPLTNIGGGFYETDWERMDEMRRQDPSRVRNDPICVCGHPLIKHVAVPSAHIGATMACTHPGCACGPGCVHEGFVNRDGPDSIPMSEAESAVAAAPVDRPFGCDDITRLDWIESILRPSEGYREIYLAGLRNGRGPVDDPWQATAFQVELQDRAAVSGATLREAIDMSRVAEALRQSHNDTARHPLSDDTIGEAS